MNVNPIAGRWRSGLWGLCLVAVSMAPFIAKAGDAGCLFRSLPTAKQQQLLAGVRGPNIALSLSKEENAATRRACAVAESAKLSAAYALAAYAIERGTATILATRFGVDAAASAAVWNALAAEDRLLLGRFVESKALKRGFDARALAPAYLKMGSTMKRSDPELYRLLVLQAGARAWRERLESRF